jgi:hypothetical protein
MTAVICGCAVAVANGQVSVPGVQTPQVNVPPLQQVPQVPSTPQVPQVSLPKAPQVSLPKAPSVQLPSTQGVAPKVPSVRLPSTGVSGGAVGGSSGSSGASGGGGSSGASGASGAGAGRVAQGGAGAKAAGHNGRAGVGRARPLTTRQRAARHERRLREAAQQLEGCLPALSSFDRQVIVLRGGLHGRSPLSRTRTAQRLNVGAGRVKSAERSGLAGLRKADAKSGCGLRSGAGRNAAARRLAGGSVAALSPLAVAGSSPALVSTDSLPKDRGKVLAEHASSSKAETTPRRAGLLPTSGGDGSSISAAVWVALLGALALAGAGVLLLRHRRASDPYGYYAQAPSVYPSAWGAGDWDDAGEWGEADQSPVNETPAPPPEAPTVDSPVARRRDRAAQAFGGVAAASAAVTFVVGRLIGRRRRR